ncbi:MAG: cytidylyltransferase domain-containing protein, partial [bacterium]
MIPALLIGREGSVGFPNKNVYPVLGRKLMEYPLLAAKNATLVDEVYVSTDSERIKRITRDHFAKVIDRPAHLCTKEALGEDAFQHAYQNIKNETGKDIEMIVLLFCNAPCVLPAQIDDGIRVLRDHPGYDSAVTVSRYNMYSPVRARRIGEDGLLHPFIPFENYPADMAINCDRDAQGDVYFADVCLSIVRPHCLDDLDYGILPQKWMGRKIYPIKQWGGLDVDYEWQIPLVEHWLQRHGFAEKRCPDKLKIDLGDTEKIHS